MLIKSLLFIFQTQQSYLCIHKARHSRYFHSSIVPLLYYFNCNAAHFDAHLGPGPDIPDSPQDSVLVQRLNKVNHDLLELTQVVGLVSHDLLVTDAPEEGVTGALSGLHAGHVISVLPENTRVLNADVKTMDNFSQIHLTERLAHKGYNAKFCIAPKVYKLMSSGISWENAFNVDL